MILDIYYAVLSAFCNSDIDMFDPGENAAYVREFIGGDAPVQSLALDFANFIKMPDDFT